MFVSRVIRESIRKYVLHLYNYEYSRQYSTPLTLHEATFMVETSILLNRYLCISFSREVCEKR